MRMYAFTTVEGLLSQRRPHARPGRRSGATLNGLAGRSACSGRHSWHHHGMRYADRENAGDQLAAAIRSEEHTSELQSHSDLVCRLLLEKKKNRTDEMTASEYYRTHQVTTAEH